MAAHKKAQIIYVCGMPGSGKSLWVKRNIDKDKRVLIWDVNDEYEGLRITTRPQLVKALRGGVHKPLRVRYVPSAVTRVEFDYWAKAAFMLGNATIVAEETADVTHAGKAPDGWGMVIRRSRHQRLKVIGITQRPTESDKTTLGNASLIHCCKLRRHDDRVYMAKEMDVPVESVSKLQPLEWLEVDQYNHVETGKLTV
jgi:hypothetical protein